jgi:murein DD-endopeptidase MepM/ murein hydrolase activator NlpD
MRPPRRERTGKRRDGGVRVIRTNEVRYPGVELPPLPEDLQERYRAAMEAETVIAPARDTGLEIENRVARQARTRKRSQIQMFAVGAVAVLGLLLLAIGWRTASDLRAPVSPLGGGAVAGVTAMGSGAAWSPFVGSPAKPVNVSAAAAPATAGPTPYFANYKGLRLRLPVRVKSLTEVGFHQASYGYALSMNTSLPNADLGDASEHRGTGRKSAAQPKGPNAVLIGRVLRMWRPRPGRPDTAADVGAKPGTDVLSPVSGMVIKVKLYKLYGKWDDYEVHIQPDGFPNLDIVMIHLTDVTCAPGDTVVAGETRIAAIRKTSNKFYDQLASYTKGGGDHVHLQVNDTTDPTYKGLVGAIDPAALRAQAASEAAAAALTPRQVVQ